MPLQSPGCGWCLHKPPVPPGPCWEQFWCTLALLSSHTQGEGKVRCHRGALTHSPAAPKGESGFQAPPGVSSGLCGHMQVPPALRQNRAGVTWATRGFFLPQAQMPLPPHSDRGIIPRFKEDDAVFGPRTTTLFSRNTSVPCPRLKWPRWGVIRASPGKNMILQGSTEAKNYSSLLGMLLLSREGQSYSHLEQ